MNTTVSLCSNDSKEEISEDNMVVVLTNETNSETEKLLVECLQTAGFDVVSTKNNSDSSQIIHEKDSVIESEESNTQEFILPSIPRLREVFEFIELNYDQNIKLKEVAQAVGYSPAYLTDLVRKLTGKTVNNWIIERRLAEASTLLLETDYTVEEIAFKVGYQNINHFYCQFRNYYQSTPRSWRESQRLRAA